MAQGVRKAWRCKQVPPLASSIADMCRPRPLVDLPGAACELRDYFSKKITNGDNWRSVGAARALRLNQRPRETLGFETPAVKLRASASKIPWTRIRGLLG